MEIVSSGDWYQSDQGLDNTRLLNQILAKVKAKKRFHAIRGVGGMHKLSSSIWKQMISYEQGIKDIISKNMTLLCTYSLAHCPLKYIPKLIEAHHKTFVKKGSSWEVVESDPT